MPTTSILVPVYNRADLLVPCIESALAQTVEDFEVVVVDNASSDGTWEVCRHYASADSRVRIFRNAENIGPVRNWARCMSEARGKYGNLLFSDDMLAPDFLAKTLPWLDDPETGFVYSAVRIGASQEDTSLALVWPRGTGRYPSRQFIIGALRPHPWNPASPACALFRLDDLRRNLRSELPLPSAHDMSAVGAGSDLLLYLLTASTYPKFATIAEPLAYFRAHPGSITAGGSSGQVALSYALATWWFARTYTDCRFANRILGRHWVQQLRNNGRPISPSTAAARYGGAISPRALVAAALVYLPSIVEKSVRRRILQSRAESGSALGVLR